MVDFVPMFKKALRERSAEAVILECLDEEGGPVLADRSEADQRGFDATCRKLNRFLRTRMPASCSNAT